MKRRKGASINPRDFQREKPRYQSGDFIIPSNNNQGHSVRLQARCKPEYARRIDELIHSRKFPFKTLSDFLRWAVHHGLQFLDELKPEIGLEMDKLELINNIANKKREQMDFANSLEKVTGTTHDLLSRGARSEAIKTVLEVQEKLESMESGYWRDWYLKELKRRFGYLLEDTNT